jgi:hypothetical protein
LFSLWAFPHDFCGNQRLLLQRTHNMVKNQKQDARTTQPLKGVLKAQMGPPKQQALPPPTPVPSAPVPLAEKQVFRKSRRRKSPAALRNPEMERALRLQWSELLEHERDMLIAGAHSPAHVPSEQ